MLPGFPVLLTAATRRIRLDAFVNCVNFIDGAVR